MGHGLYRGGVAEEVAEEGTEAIGIKGPPREVGHGLYRGCPLYTSDAADE